MKCKSTHAHVGDKLVAQWPIPWADINEGDCVEVIGVSRSEIVVRNIRGQQAAFTWPFSSIGLPGSRWKRFEP